MEENVQKSGPSSPLIIIIHYCEKHPVREDQERKKKILTEEIKHKIMKRKPTAP
jgi:hypothetical protein